MKELDYDSILAPPPLKIKIGGEKYEVPQPSLQLIIDYETKVKELHTAAQDGMSGSEVGDKWIAVIRSIFTCIPAEVLKEKNLSVLRAIAKDCTQFMQESMYSDAPTSQAETQKEDKKKEK